MRGQETEKQGPEAGDGPALATWLLVSPCSTAHNTWAQVAKWQTHPNVTVRSSEVSLRLGCWGHSGDQRGSREEDAGMGRVKGMRVRDAELGAMDGMRSWCYMRAGHCGCLGTAVAGAGPAVRRVSLLKPLRKGKGKRERGLFCKGWNIMGCQRCHGNGRIMIQMEIKIREGGKSERVE